MERRVPLRPRNFLPTIVLVFVAAFLADFGNLLTETLAPPLTHKARRERDAARSGDDGGFSITLSSPRQPYLLGRQTITIDPTIPSGDRIAQVDIFVDGRLVFTDMQPPYTYETDFGGTIRPHLIVASAVTRVGRRAKVSFISRSGDLSETSAKPLTIIPTVVRDAEGRPVEDLSVSDFTLLENGARQRIVHFDNRPAPASIAVLAAAGGAGDTDRQALLKAAAAFAGRLPPYQALALQAERQAKAKEPPTGRRPKGAAAGDAGPPAVDQSLEFSYGPEAFLNRLQGTESLASARPWPLGEAIQAAVDGLRARSDRRVLLLLVAGQQAAEDPSLQAALEALSKGQVTLLALLLGQVGDVDPYLALGRAAEESGGQMMSAPDAEGMASACGALSDSLLHQYLIGYMPDAPEKPGWRAIELRVNRPDIKVQVRKGYSID